MIILTITPLITLLIFNIYFRNYVSNGITMQLKNTVTTTQVLIRNELSQTIYETDKTKIDQAIAELNKILRTSKIALNTELLMFKDTGEMIYPIDYQNTFLNSDLIGKAREILPSLNVVKVAEIDLYGKKYSLMGYRLTQLPIDNIPYIVFISSMDVSDPMFMTINLVLVLTMIFGILLGTLLAFRIAEGVQKPVRELCDATIKIGERKKFVLEHQTDIEEIKQLSDNILSMANRIELYDKAQKSFLQNASHELKTPLMSIQGYAEGIENGLFPDVKNAGIIIKEESQKLDRLVSELLVLSRIENQNYGTDLEDVIINDIMKEYISRCEGIAIKSKKTIIYKETPDILTMGYNESLFTQCFMNAASNAIRYAKERVTISLENEAREIKITVQDDGDGIPEEDLPYIFDRFFKGKNGQFGLGLAIAKSSAQAMSGSIEASNTESGAKFILRFPSLQNI